MQRFNYFYLDKEKDIIVNLYKNDDEMTYILETPNHKSGNLITNLARLTNHQLSFNRYGLKIMKGSIPCYVTSSNTIVYPMRLGGIKVADIYPDGRIEVKASISAISKTLMSQTKDYTLSLQETLVKTYILKECKFKTDLHTHSNANLLPDVLMALGIKHQINYPYYYIKKLKLNISEKQKEKLEQQREIVKETLKDCQLTGKYLERRIDDNTFINFADLILNNIEHTDENIKKIRASLTILKDGQAVFTNLEKVYLFRYVFTKASLNKDVIELKNIDSIPDRDIINYVNKMIEDGNNPEYCNNTVFQDKLLWIARSYKAQGIEYAEITDTSLVKSEAVNMLEQIHEIMPKIEKETGVIIRFLAAMRRTPLTIIRDQKTPDNYLRDNLDVFKAICKDPYIAGSDFVGEEINDILELKPVISELVGIAKNDPYMTIRIHAGENDSLTDNVANAIYCVSSSLEKGQKFPKMRVGHGIYTAPLNTPKGKRLIKQLKKNNVILEFQITSNVRLNNLSVLTDHPIKKYLANDINCVQGSDGFGFYGVDSFDEQLALINLLHISHDDLLKIRRVEDKVIKDAKEGFKVKEEKFNAFLAGRSLSQGLNEQIAENRKTGLALSFTLTSKIESSKALEKQIEEFVWDKTPVIVAGGSFNSEGRKSIISEQGKKIIDKLVNELDSNKYFFVVGHKLEGYEKYLIKKAKKKFKIYAIVPSLISEKEAEKLQKSNLAIRVSTESLGMGIYKSFNYEIFERRNSLLIAMDGNSAGINLLQEAKNGKGECTIYVFCESEPLMAKAQSLEGYVKLFAYEE